MKRGLSLEIKIIVFIFFIIFEISLLNINRNLEQINNNLVKITNAMVEQNAILKFNPALEE